jgi:hypothetical protein
VHRRRALRTYRALDRVVPDGYFGDPEVRGFEAVSPSGCTQRLGANGVPAPGAVVDATFVNTEARSCSAPRTKAAP